MSSERDTSGDSALPAGRDVWLVKVLREFALTTVGLITVMALVYRLLLVYGKSNVWSIDGLAQHFPELYFWNGWIRGFLASPSRGLELWSWNLGLGADVIGTLAFPIVGDPFVWATLAAPMPRMEAAYLAVYLIRVLAAGLVAAAYFRLMGARALPAWVGSVVYVFSSFLLVLTLQHPFFVNPMVCLPLMLIGVERLLRGKGGWFLTFAVTTSAYANYYFFFMLTVVTAVYVAIRIFDFAEKPRRVTSHLQLSGRVAKHYLLGVGLAAPLLVPAGIAVAQTARTQVERTIPMFYDLAMYRSLLASFMSAIPGLRTTHLGLTAPGLIMVIAAIVRPRAPRVLRFMPILLLVALCLPAAGSLMNGFSFPSRRFVFMLPLFVGALVALRLSDDEPFSAREIKAAAVVLGAYTMAMLAFLEPLTVAHGAPILLGTLTLGLLVCETWGTRRSGQSGRTSPSPFARLLQRTRFGWQRWAIVALLVANVALNAHVMYGRSYGNLLEQYVDRHTVMDAFEHNPGAVVGSLDRDVLERVTNGRTVRYNSSMVHGFPGTSFYYSTMSEPLSSYRDELELTKSWSQFSFDGVDERAMATSLLGVGYYVTEPNWAHYAPYGFEVVTESDDAVVLRNKHSLPFGFVFEHAIDRSEYLELGPVDRQSVMLQGAVMDIDDIDDLPVVHPRREARSLPFEVRSQRGATLDLKAMTFTRTVPDASVVLSVAPAPQAELYVYVSGINDVIEPLPGQADVQGEFGAQSVRSAPGVKWPTQPAQSMTTYTSGAITQTARWNTPGYSYYWGHDSYAVHLGYSADARDSIEIEPLAPGVMTFDSIEVLALPMNGLAERVARLREHPMTDIEVTPNSVSGAVTTDHPGILFLSMPYSPGWTAMVDGQPEPVVRVNTAFSGVRLSPGTHWVELHYVTPGLRSGVVIAVLATVAILLMAAFGRKRAARGEQR